MGSVAVPSRMGQGLVLHARIVRLTSRLSVPAGCGGDTMFTEVWQAAGSVGWLARESGQGLTAAAISVVGHADGVLAACRASSITTVWWSWIQKGWWRELYRSCPPISQPRL